MIQMNTKIKPLVETDKEFFLSLCVQILIKPISERAVDEKITIKRMATKVNFLAQQDLQDNQITDHIADFLQYKYLNQNHFLFNEGDLGSRFYILLRGTISVQIQIADKNGIMIQNEVSKLQAGDSFGELVLQNQQYRTFTCYGQTNCDLAYLERDDFLYLTSGDYLKNKNAKLNFLGRYQFFQNWSLREITALSYYFEEKNFKLNDTIFTQRDLSESLYFLQEGNVELQKAIYQKVSPDIHQAVKTYKKVKRFIPMCIINESQIFGEDCFFDDDNVITFTIKKLQKPIRQAKKEIQDFQDDSISSKSDQSNQLIEKQKFKRRKYAAVCRSKQAKVYIIKMIHVEAKFCDTVTRRIFHEFIREHFKRTNQFIPEEAEEQMTQPQLILGIKEEINKLTTAFDKKKPQITQTEGLYDIVREQKYIKKLQTHDHFGDNVEVQKLSKKENQRINSVSSVKDGHNINLSSLLQVLSGGPFYKINLKNQKEESMKFTQKLVSSVHNRQSEEHNAMTKFKNLFLKMNKSYLRTKNYCQQKNLGPDKLFYYSFLKGKVQKNKKNRGISVPQVKTENTNSKSYEMGLVGQTESKASYLRSAFDYMAYDNKSATNFNSDNEQEYLTGQSACETKNKYLKVQKYNRSEKEDIESEDLFQSIRPFTGQYQQRARQSQNIVMLNKTEGSGMKSDEKQSSIMKTNSINLKFRPFSSSNFQKTQTLNLNNTSTTISGKKKSQFLNITDGDISTKGSRQTHFQSNISQKDRSKSFETYF